MNTYIELENGSQLLSDCCIQPLNYMKPCGGCDMRKECDTLTHGSCSVCGKIQFIEKINEK
jgi:hypothetical protein